MTIHIDCLPNEILFHCVYYVTNIVDIWRLSCVDTKFRDLISYSTKNTTYHLMMQFIQLHKFKRVKMTSTQDGTVIFYHSKFDYPLLLKSDNFRVKVLDDCLKCHVHSDGKMLIESLNSHYYRLNKYFLFDGQLIFKVFNKQRGTPNQYNHMVLSDNCNIFCQFSTKSSYFYFLEFLDINQNNLGIESNFVLRLTQYQIKNDSIVLGFLLIDHESYTKVGASSIYHYIVVLKDNQINSHLDFFLTDRESELFTYSFGDFDNDYFFIFAHVDNQRQLCFYKKHRIQNSQDMPIRFLYKSVNKSFDDGKVYHKRLKILKGENYNPYILDLHSKINK